ncbi:uncharacterized protein LOC135947953 [Cloeon dipterum]|uniref:uncharacterized protein LOC135947953 n=1 Tax=Cloeon dipterum TaxID=197152 RepID=UPI0032204493
MPWSRAHHICCSLGMRLISVQSYEKLICLDSILGEEQYGYWTSGTNMNCSNQRYRWCSPEFRDFIKPSLNLDNSTTNFQLYFPYPPGSTSKLCVVLKKSPTLGPILTVDSCEMSFRKPICEGRVKAQSHLQEVFNECKATHRVTQRDIEKFNNTDIERSSFKMKCFSSCIAELLGLVYDNGAFWEDEVEKAIKKVKDPRALEDFRSLMKKYPASLFKKASDNLNALRMMLIEQNKEETWKSTLFINMALEKFSECNTIVRSNKEVECSYVYSFLKCFTNGSTSLEKFWNRDLHNLFDSREYALTISQMPSDFMTMEHLSNYYYENYGVTKNNDYLRLQQYIEYVDSQSFSEEFTGSMCTFELLRPKNLTLNDACLTKEKYFESITGFDDILKRKTLEVTQSFYHPMAAAAICHEANGSLITSADFSHVSILTNITSNAMQLFIMKGGMEVMQPKGTSNILMDEIYKDSKGMIRWCSTSAEAPNDVSEFLVANSINLVCLYEDYRAKLVLYPVTSMGSTVVTFFCKFDKSFLALCKTIASN